MNASPKEPVAGSKGIAPSSTSEKYEYEVVSSLEETKPKVEPYDRDQHRDETARKIATRLLQLLFIVLLVQYGFIIAFTFAGKTDELEYVEKLFSAVLPVV